MKQAGTKGEAVNKNLRVMLCSFVQRALLAVLSQVLEGQGNTRILRTSDEDLGVLLEANPDFLEVRNAIDPGYAAPGGQGAYLQWLSHRGPQPPPASNTRWIPGGAQLWRQRLGQRLSQRSTAAVSSQASTFVSLAIGAVLLLLIIGHVIISLQETACMSILFILMNS